MTNDNPNSINPKKATENEVAVRNALTRLLVVLVVTIGFGIYSYGWAVTDIDLERPQDERRQQTVQRALRELLSPAVFSQDRIIVDIVANFRVGCVPGEVVEQPDEQPLNAVIRLSSDCGDIDEQITVEVDGLPPLLAGAVRWRPPGEDAATRPRTILETNREDFAVANNGQFVGTIQVPQIRETEGEIAQIVVRVLEPVGSVRFSPNANRVASAMAETIFMALVATTVAIPIAVLLSFFAARNLMVGIRLSLGSLLLSFVGFALGVFLGVQLLTELIRQGITAGNTPGTVQFFAIFAVMAAFVFGAIFVARLNQQRKSEDITSTLIQVVWALIMAGFLAYFIGAVAGLGLLGAEQINSLSNTIRPEQAGIGTILADAVGSVGNLLDVLSQLIFIGAPLVAALIGGLILPGVVSTVFAAPLRRVPDVVGHSVGVVLGGISGMVLLGAMGLIGMWAALLTLLAPFIAALIGGQIPVLIYNQTLSKRLVKNTYDANRLDKLTRFILFWVGAVPTAIYTFTSLNLSRSIINGILPSEATSTFLGLTLPIFVIDTMIIGLVLGAIAGGLAGTQGSFPVGNVLYNTSRTLLNTVRSIEPLIMGLVFVIWVGTGPFAGVLALTLHSIASLGKLYSEQVENIDPGPLEALDSTGANRLQTIVYAVVPQIIPPYIAFTMYRWDINVRMSTIIGFVGGGGIGLLLQQEINLLEYRSAGVAVLAIAIVVSILDYASAYIRKRVM